MTEVSEPKIKLSWPDGADKIGRDLDALHSRMEDIKSDFSELQKAYNTAHDHLGDANILIEILRAALQDAKYALFHGAPVTVGLENQINHAIQKADGF